MTHYPTLQNTCCTPSRFWVHVFTKGVEPLWWSRIRLLRSIENIFGHHSFTSCIWFELQDQESWIRVFKLSSISIQTLTYFLCRSGRFRGGASKTGGQPKSPGGPNSGQGPSPTLSAQGNHSSGNLAPRVPPLQSSPSLSQTLSMDESGNVINTPVTSSNGDILAAYSLPSPKPLWLNNTYAKHIVKGNFMTLSARPKTVEPGEWIAHQGEMIICSKSFTKAANLVKLWSTTAIYGTLSRLFMRRRMTELQSAILERVLVCQLARKYLLLKLVLKP